MCCLSGDLEYFNGSVWKKISEYKEGDLVLQYSTGGYGEVTSEAKFSRVLDDRPMYISRNKYVPFECTAESGIVYKKGRNVVRMSFKDFFSTVPDAAGCEIPCSFPFVGGTMSLSKKDVKRMCRCIRRGSLGELSGVPGLEIFVQDGRLSRLVFSLDLDSRKRLLLELGIGSLFFDMYDCGEDFEFADILFTSAVTTFSGRRFLLDCVDGRWLLCEPSASAGDHYSDPNVAVEFEADSSVHFDYFKPDDGDILGKNSRLFEYVTGESEKYTLAVPTGMLVVRKYGTAFVIGV